MPLITCTTNVAVADQKAFVLELSEASAKILKRPLKHIAVKVTYTENLALSGTFDPAVLLSIVTLGNLTLAENVQYATEYCEFFREKLGVAPDRGCIEFSDPGADNIAMGGAIVSELLRKLKEQAAAETAAAK